MSDIGRIRDLDRHALHHTKVPIENAADTATLGVVIRQFVAYLARFLHT